jgi:hypothetical protein
VAIERRQKIVVDRQGDTLHLNSFGCRFA